MKKLKKVLRCDGMIRLFKQGPGGKIHAYIST